MMTTADTPRNAMKDVIITRSVRSPVTASHAPFAAGNWRRVVHLGAFATLPC